MNRSKGTSSLISIFLLVVLAFTNVQPASSKAAAKILVASPESSDPANPAFAPDVVLMGVQDGISIASDSTGGLQRHRTNSTSLDLTLDSIGALSITPLFPIEQARQAASQDVSGTDLGTIYRLQLKSGTDVKSAVKALTMLPEVAFAEPDYIAFPADVSHLGYAPTSRQSSPPFTVNQLTIDDPLYSQQWGLAKINIEGAWSSTYGSPTVSIAVIDSGIDLTHVDLAAHLWVNPGEIAGNGIDDDSNGLIDDVKGWNFVYGNNDVSDDNGHGTLVAGVAAAVGGNGQGIAGACPLCTIMPVKVMQASGAANYSDIAAGILYAAQKGAKVINLSLGGYANSNTLKNAIDTAVNTYGAVVVAGAGNDNLNQPFYPAAYDNVLAVAGTQTDDTKVGTSNYASWVDVSAPGINILTTALGGGWVDNSGTSFAAPFTSGLAGLLRTLHPDWSTNLTRAQIIHTTDNIDSVNPAYEGMLGNGRINAQTATLATATPLLNVSSYAIDGVTNGTPAPGSTVNLNVAIRNIWGTVTNTTGTLSTSDPYVTVTSASASYSDIDAYDAATNAIPFTFSVSSSAPYGHAMMFSLTINGTGGVNVVLPLEITTQSGTTSVSGMINSDTVWANDKTYLVVGNVLVSSGVTLTIQPGTVVKFNPDMSLLVGGTLIADGAQNQEVVFTSAQPSPAPGDWGIIKFTASSVDAVVDGAENYVSGSVFRYARIEYGKGVGLVDGLPYFSHVTFYKNSGNNEGVVTGCVDGASALHWVGKTPRTGSLVVRDSLFVENQSQGFATNQPGGGSVYFDVTSNQFLRNSGAAVVICNDFGGAQIVSNIIKDNGAGISLGNTGSGVIITDNFISGSKQPAYTAGFGVDIYSGSPIISHNIFANNGQGQTMCNGRCSVINIFSGGAPTVTSNTFVGNWLDSLIYFKWGGAGTYQNNNWAGNQVNYIFYRSTDSNQDVTATSNYWGTIDTTVIDGLIYDYLDDFNPGQVFYQPLLTAPDSSAPAFLWNATVTPDPAGIQQATFTLTFSKSMDPSADPIVTFGATSPYADYSVLDNGQWFDDHTWSATYDITSLVLRGTHTINVSGAKGTDGMEIPTDTRFSFVVDYAGSISDTTPPVQPTVAASGDGTLTTISASWSSSDAESPITQYRYGIGTTPGARDVVAWNYVSSTTTSMTRTGLNLTYGQPYYVTVGARNEGGLWSDSGVSAEVIAGVVPAPSAFDKSAPLNGAVNQSTSPTLTWGTSAGATSYEYCYDTTNDNVCSSWTANGTSTSKALSSLSTNTTYYWQVRANNAGGTTYANGSPTAFWSFTTVPNAPAVFSKNTPVTGAVNQSTSPTLTWSASSGAASYEYCYDTTNDNACSSWMDNGASTSKALSGLASGATYYWHVRVNNAGGTVYSNGLPTAFWSFTTLSGTTTFSDVPADYWAWQFIERLYGAGITGGCSLTPLMYCPETNVNRAQMAVFLLRGEHGSAYVPPAVGTGTGFTDVPSDYWSAAWIKQLALEGITSGCGPSLYCPETSVTRDQMAVFLLRAKYGASYTPPPATGVFTDVPTTHWAAPWIEQLAAEGITGGCGADIYCPSTPVTRAQMAVFLVRTFNLP